MRVVEQPIQQRVRHRWVAHIFVPVVDGQLAGHYSRARMIAIFDDVEQVKSLKLRERLQPEVIEDEQVGFRQCRELLPEAAVAAGDP